MSDRLSTVQEQALKFSFPSNFEAIHYDQSFHFKKVIMPRQNVSAVDIAAFRHGKPSLWLIEVKDFSRLRGEPGAKNDRERLPEKTVRKAADTLVGLRDAAMNAGRPNEREFAARAVKRTRNRVVLHLEPFKGPKKLFPEQPSPSHVLQKMKLLSRSHPELDPNPLVLSLANTKRAGVPWTVASA